jgi:hypothetical protein
MMHLLAEPTAREQDQRREDLSQLNPDLNQPEKGQGKLERDQQELAQLELAQLERGQGQQGLAQPVREGLARDPHLPVQDTRDIVHRQPALPSSNSRLRFLPPMPLMPTQPSISIPCPLSSCYTGTAISERL